VASRASQRSPRNDLLTEVLAVPYIMAHVEGSGVSAAADRASAEKSPAMAVGLPWPRYEALGSKIQSGRPALSLLAAS
jgi:hypothetical protein